MSPFQKLCVLLLGAGSLAACSDGSRPPGQSDRRTDTGVLRQDTVPMPAPRDTAPVPPPDSPPPPHVNIDPPPAVALRSGRHDLTLQWIGWNAPGRATLTPAEDGWYRIEGRQQSRDGDYLRISGRIQPLTPKELRFVGRIETRVHFNNGGRPCVKEGEQRFLSTKGRQYWRLQNMATCGEKNTVDYVDLYF
ncbi:hypothetical protein [Flaviaesturariibacter aridisoli]|uniref:Lipoprotein n=1 Tax=Flaviaesturariibacter aridisoli TaxID=2545761 RepID=A0A4V6P653_9BACT|nr:hypothetical protein [Flaviaesturariibacter aridisoli]TCZ67051.1 hypothetical protein E0486_16320 [Flaviaesturariibacter aridisoli]